LKILFENYALDATVTSTSASTNYPPSNLVHPFLRKRYQNITGDDLITFLFDADKTVNSIYFGFHNADEETLLTEDGEVLTTEDDIELFISTATLIYSLYSFGNTLLYTGTLNMVNQFEAVHFTAVPLVRMVTVETQWSGLGNAGYLGGVGIGNSYTMPYFSTAWDNGMIDNSPVSSSLVGQVLQNYIEPQDIKKFTWNGVTSTIFAEIKALVKSTGKGKPIWVDYFEESHDIVQPIYAITTGIENASRNEMLYDFSMTFTEAR
jgi:hypothetical protein